MLNGATLSGSAAVFVTPSKAASKVTFRLDGGTQIVESSAPFDFAGTSYAVARLYNFGGLKVGKHTLTAVITYSGGSTKSLSATFTR